MSHHPLLSRRGFAGGLAAIGGASLAGAPAIGARSTPLTGQMLIDRIKAQCAREGINWAAQTVDTVKLGNPDRPVKGVACTFMGTLSLMKAAVAKGANFIVTHEPIFYSHNDATVSLQDDTIYRAKRAFAETHGLTIWRFHDHWHQIKPEPMSEALTRKLGWEGYLDPASSGYERRFIRPPITLADLAEELTQRMPSTSIRVIGDPALLVRRIVNVGHQINNVIPALATADVGITGEAREWDSGEYMRDLIALGERKGLILIAHERAEEEGMKRCAEWLRPRVPEVPVTFISSGEPFRTPRFL